MFEHTHTHTLTDILLYIYMWGGKLENNPTVWKIYRDEERQGFHKVLGKHCCTFSIPARRVSVV